MGMKKQGKGYEREVTLVSPEGKRVTFWIPGRQKFRDGSMKLNSSFGTIYPMFYRRDKEFRRLLSAGWSVVPNYDASSQEISEEEKKKTKEVIGNKKTGNSSHGGKHASCEVKNSPNAARKGRRSRKSRGGRSHAKHTSNAKRRRFAKITTKPAGLKVQKCRQTGSGAVYAPQPLYVNTEVLESAKKSGELLAELVGRSQKKVRRNIKINPEMLLTALEIGDSPLPALEYPDQRPKLKILVTPDCSGSTQNWNGLGQAWAMHLSNLPEVDVIYLNNFNGKLGDSRNPIDENTQKIIKSVDLVIYLGDGDGYELCQNYAQMGTKVLAFDSYCANYCNPRLRTTSHGTGCLYWVDRVSAKEPDSWYEAIKKCLRK